MWSIENCPHSLSSCTHQIMYNMHCIFIKNESISGFFHLISTICVFFRFFVSFHGKVFIKSIHLNEINWFGNECAKLLPNQQRHIYIYMNPTSNLVPTSFPLNPKTWQKIVSKKFHWIRVLISSGSEHE